ncbi:MAG: DegT/DnrJ/EryC1/StrS family aminotransferase, partial [Candidatus Omnitrophica bacterium]|nr:DegT/DnrJ/EryC1/StrS family aminotransferase [Candidatus Omnitrophota bacterium]
MKIPFLDLKEQSKVIEKDVLRSLHNLMQRNDFILGRDLFEFEKEFAGFCESKFCVGVNSGTDALFLGLKSLDIGPGDEVIVPAFTYIASALAVTYTGAKPVFVDIDQVTYNIDTAKVKERISRRTKAILPVHLYGHPAEMFDILKLARKYNLKVIEDAAQAHGTKYKFPKGNWKIAGSIADIGCFSFYPTKNLGAFGDGGAVVVNSRNIYKKLLMLRDYGRKSRYEHVRLGYNSRLDTLQAAILRAKLKHLNHWNSLRRKNAGFYSKLLQEVEGVIIPKQADYAKHVYHVYAIRVKNRKQLLEEFARRGISALIHYPIPLHLQKVYEKLGYKKGDFPIAEKVAG